MKKLLVLLVTVFSLSILSVYCTEEVPVVSVEQYEMNLYHHITGEKNWVYERVLDRGEQEWTEEEYNNALNAIVLDEPLGVCSDIECKYYMSVNDNKLYQQTEYNGVIYTVTWENGSVINLTGWAVK